jgi:cytochrome c biogenesis protein CcmG/thiol:disulfide interchange protein DsbE
MKCLTFLLLFVGSFLVGGSPVVSAQSFQAEVNRFKTPVTAPDFSLKELGGGEISLKGLRGKVVILNFYTTW